MRALLLATWIAAAGGWNLSAQAPGVPIAYDWHGSDDSLIKAAVAVKEEGNVLSERQIRRQLNRKECRLNLPEPSTSELSGAEIYEHARAAHVRVGHLYKCEKCTKWHLNLAGGYAITADGAVATCYHVVAPGDHEEQYLIAATPDGTILPVKEILAASKSADTCIVQVDSDAPLKPLALRTDVRPGDTAWCYSAPADHNGYFSSGIVNRFFRHGHSQEPQREFPLRMNVSTDWAPGSSGAAVLDSFGNAIGHVSEISAQDEPAANRAERAGNGRPTPSYIVFHKAVCASDVLELIKQP